MINFNPNVNAAAPSFKSAVPQMENPEASKADFSKAVKTIEQCISKVDDSQRASDASIQDLLTGKNSDITAVVSSVAKADMSFKVLVGVRNKLIEAYKQTMNMSL